MQLLQRFIFRILLKKYGTQPFTVACRQDCTEILLFHDLQDLHGAGLYADTAGNALGGGTALRSHHNLHGANLCTLAAGGAELLIDHVYTGLGILGDRTGLTDLGALAALDTGHGFCGTVFLHDTDAGQVLIKGLVEGIGASTHTLQAGHALSALLNHQLLHM